MTPGQRLHEALVDQDCLYTNQEWHSMSGSMRDGFEQVANLLVTNTLADKDAMHAAGWVTMDEAHQMAHVPYTGGERQDEVGRLTVDPTSLTHMMTELRGGVDFDDVLQDALDEYAKPRGLTMRRRDP